MRYFLSLGSNLGNKRENLRRALDALKKAAPVKVVRASSIFSTQPVGKAAQPWFINQVIEVETPLSPDALLCLAKRVERDLGRRGALRNGPRTIDIDILLAGNRVISAPRLVIPHPRMAERKFVLIPLKEIAPEAVHPVLGVEIAELLNRTADRSVVRKMEPRRTRAGRRKSKRRRAIRPS